MMTRSKALVVLLSFALGGAVPIRAQAPEAAAAQGEGAPGAGCEDAPIAVAARFLGLVPEQVRVLVQLLHERQAAVVPVQLEIAARERRVQELIAAGGDPAEIGRLVVEIHQLRQAAGAAQAQFLARVGALLTDEQRARWQGVQAAARLQPVLPAFQALGML
jgi:HPt (histidine-containing phosphotransfer) domain-containing protein